MKYNKERLIIFSLMVISIFLTFFTALIRYFIYKDFIYPDILFSLNDFYYLVAFIYFFKVTLFNYPKKMYIILSSLLTMILIFDELMQKYIYPILIHYKILTFSIYDIIAYITAFISTVIIIELISFFFKNNKE